MTLGLNVAKEMPEITPKQGQYLAFIYYYSKVNRRAPAEGDMQAYFGVTAPSVHQMVLNLERQGFISRVPGKVVPSASWLPENYYRTWNRRSCPTTESSSHASGDSFGALGWIGT
jgi:hypothetical protein